jgi:hypothetical protein
MIEVDNGKGGKDKYVRNPNNKIAPAWGELRMQLYKKRIELVNRARDKPIDDPYSNEIIYRDGYVADKLVPQS